MPLTIAGNSLTGPGSNEFEQARKVNLEYVSHLPNFMADEIVKRYRSTATSPQWTTFDTLQSEVTFQEIVASAPRSAGTVRPGTNPSSRFPASSGTEAMATRSGRCSIRSVP